MESVNEGPVAGMGPSARAVKKRAHAGGGAFGSLKGTSREIRQLHSTS